MSIIEKKNKKADELKFKLMQLSSFDKKVNLTLVGLDGNAFYLMGAFASQARREKWSQLEIDFIMYKCKSGDYNNLLCTLMDHCKDPSGGESEEIIHHNGRTYKAID